jgi:hypothetical protein
MMKKKATADNTITATISGRIELSSNIRLPQGEQLFPFALWKNVCERRVSMERFGMQHEPGRWARKH